MAGRGGNLTPVADWERLREAALCGREAAVYSEESINPWRLARCWRYRDAVRSKKQIPRSARDDKTLLARRRPVHGEQD